MTLGDNVEQRLTGRPDSYMPAHTLERLVGLPQRPDRERQMLNLGMHVGQAILLGAWRGLMAEGGLRGARPWTWPRDELVIDVVHKGVYAFTTGVTADALAEERAAWVEARG